VQAQLLRVRAARPATWHVWLWLLEEWSLAHTLLGAQRCVATLVPEPSPPPSPSPHPHPRPHLTLTLTLALALALALTLTLTLTLTLIRCDATLVAAVEGPLVLALALAVPGALAPELQHYLHPCEAYGSGQLRGSRGQHDAHAAQGGWHVELHLRIDDAQCCAPCAPV
jgi:hypothetical protein